MVQNILIAKKTNSTTIQELKASDRLSSIHLQFVFGKSFFFEDRDIQKNRIFIVYGLYPLGDCRFHVSVLQLDGPLKRH